MPDRPLAESLHNLPRPVTSFIGRVREIADIRDLLMGCPLLTLTGAGGIGKTRLAQEAAAGLSKRVEDGIWLAELASVTDPALVVHELATALGVNGAPERLLLARIVETIRDRQLVVILDNCEHLLQATADLVTALLRACPRLRVLATSRQPLGIAGETTYRVPPLSLASHEPHDRCEAVTLFVDRARAIQPSFELANGRVAAVHTICARLDGIPLAIELAAARISVLAPEGIAARLDDRFHLLTGGGRTALPRYRTLRAMIDWSHDLLNRRERMLWRRLAIFADGWTLEAAEAICSDEEILAEDVLDLLAELVAKSIVQAEERHGEMRYWILESLRAYAAEQLDAAGETGWLGERHRDWHVALAERARVPLSGPDAIVWLDRLECERENLRLALNWSLDHDDPEPGLQLVGALCRFWLVRGPYAETRAILARLITMSEAVTDDDAASPARPHALVTAGWLAMRQDDRSTGQAHFQEALRLSQLHGDLRGVAIARYLLGLVARVSGYDSAARRQYAIASTLFSDLQEDIWKAHVGLELGIMAYNLDDLDAARAHHTASLEIFQAHQHVLGVMWARNELGEVALREGAIDEARELLTASLEVARRANDRERIAMNLAAFGGVAAAEQQPDRAIRLVAAATLLNETTGQLNSPAWHAMLNRWLIPAHRSLSPEDRAAAVRAGRAMPLPHAIAEALAHVPAARPARDPETLRVLARPVSLAAAAPRSLAPTQAPPAADSPAAPLPSVPPRDPSPAASAAPSWLRAVPDGPSGALTRRELEVVALVARGFTNRQIAAELVITEGTAANHVKHILARLALDSRVQVAAWAVEHGFRRTGLATESASA